MKYTPFQIEVAFDNLFEKWPNQSGEASARKAFDVALKLGEDLKQIEKACEVYLLDNIGTDPDYIYKLGNFIREDHWKDYANAGDKLLKKKMEAVNVINEWNYYCCKHWCKVEDIEARIPMVMKALGNKAFKDNWLKAVKKASLLFKYEFRDGDTRKNIILSLRWFCVTDAAKHTVMKIIEGEYGKVVLDTEVKNRIGQPINYEERIKAAEEFRKLFPDLTFKKPEDGNRKRPFQETDSSKKAKEITDEILKAVGAEHIESSDDDDEPLFTQDS